jgi:hypothetical protein
MTYYDLNEVLDRMQNQDPSITCVKVNFIQYIEDSDGNEDDLPPPPPIDWKAAAKCISESQYVKYLSLLARSTDDGRGVYSNKSMVTFCNGLTGSQ